MEWYIQLSGLHRWERSVTWMNLTNVSLDRRWQTRKSTQWMIHFYKAQRQEKLVLWYFEVRIMNTLGGDDWKWGQEVALGVLETFCFFIGCWFHGYIHAAKFHWAVHLRELSVCKFCFSGKFKKFPSDSNVQLKLKTPGLGSKWLVSSNLCILKWFSEYLWLKKMGREG